MTDGQDRESYIDYAELGQTEEEAALLREHDAGEELHAYEPTSAERVPGEPWWACRTCGDDSSGLMHNNTWRNVEPLLEEVPG